MYYQLDAGSSFVHYFDSKVINFIEPNKAIHYLDDEGTLMGICIKTYPHAMNILGKIVINL